MKKILTILLAVLVCALTGCGSAATGTDTAQHAAQTAQSMHPAATIDAGLLPGGQGTAPGTAVASGDAQSLSAPAETWKATSQTGRKQTAKPTQAPAATPKTEATKANDNMIRVTISIDCKTAVNAGYSVSPSSGVILSARTVTVEKGSTVWDVLNKVARSNGIPVVKRGSGSSLYVSCINSLGEFDCGNESGWMYNVNGVYPMVSCGAYKVKSGDVIQWRYTTNLGKDLGQEWLG